MMLKYFSLFSLLIAPSFVCAKKHKKFSEKSLADKVTIIITTSPIKSNPKTDIIEASQKSLFLNPSLRDCRKIIVFDGVNENGYGENLADVKARYEEYKRRLIALTQDPSNPYFKNTTLLFLDEFKHQAWALEEAMKLVTTPFIYSHQHDVMIIRKFDVVNLIRTMEENPNIKVVRICNGENRPNLFDGPVDTHVEGISYVPLVRSFRFSDSEHFTTVKYYQEMVFPKVRGHNFAEHWMMEPDFLAHQREIIENHTLYGIYVYGRIGEPTCLHHLDGRHSN